jgi:membrane associated rhomboid family serine protease
MLGCFLYLLLILFSATLAALFVAAIARYDMGMSREAIRAGALGVAGFLFTALVLVALFKRE